MLATQVSRLKKRQDFLQARAGACVKINAFLINCHRRSIATTNDTTVEDARIGFTITRKNGNAVIRNRIKRRLSEATRIALQNSLLAGYDYVIVARRACLNMPFQELITALKTQINKCNNYSNSE